MKDLIIVFLLIQFNFVVADKLPRILGGREAFDAKETNYQVSLRLRAGEAIAFGSGFFCGGSLIAPDIVLTAAHCVVNDALKSEDPSLFLVVMGTLLNANKTAQTQVRQVQNITVMDGFYVDMEMRFVANDVALLKLDKAFELSEVVSTIRLAKNPPRVGSTCMVSGWGANPLTNLSMSEHLMVVNATIIDTAVCNSTGYLPHRVQIGSICAGEDVDGKGPCFGDSGGPLVCDGVQVGIVSWSEGCGKAEHPGVYADIPFFYDWIRAEANLPEDSGGSTHFNQSLVVYLCVAVIFHHLKDWLA